MSPVVGLISGWPERRTASPSRPPKERLLPSDQRPGNSFATSAKSATP